MTTTIPPQITSAEVQHPSLPSVAPEQLRPSRRRIDSVDLLRGIVMVIMMLDHTRDFVHYVALQGYDPTDLSHSSVKLFFTRWLTHFCAPVFVFLAGTGACLQVSRGKSKGDLSKFLITRGFWLILLEFTAVRCGAFFNFDYRFLGAAQVIWVIGVSMIVLGGLIHLPLRVIASFSVLMIALHNLLDRFHVQGWQGPDSPVPGLWAKLFILLHQGNEAFPIFGWPSPVVYALYPLIPWVGVMAAGYALGALYKMNADRRRRRLVAIGGFATLLFFAMRGINLYGDPSHWSSQATPQLTIASFFNVTKYPPSLLFLLMTLGPALIALALFETSANDPGSSRATSYRNWRTAIVPGIRNFFITFGRVPLFFYLLQWPATHLISALVHYLAGKPVAWMFDSQMLVSRPPANVGFDLAVVYACWIAGVLALYPLCQWFAGLKRRRRDWWLSYL